MLPQRRRAEQHRRRIETHEVQVDGQVMYQFEYLGKTHVTDLMGLSALEANWPIEFHPAIKQEAK